MPVYEYRCSKCGYRFDKLLRFGEKEPSCPVCQSSEVKRQVSAPSSIGGGCGSGGDSGYAPRRYS